MSATPTSSASSSSSKTTKSKKHAAHPKYEEMVKSAILTLKDRQGSSRQAIKKFVAANFKDLGDHNDTQITAAIKRFDKGIFSFPKGPSGPVKLTKPPAAEKKPKSVTKKASTGDAAKPKAVKAVKLKDTKSVKKPAALKKPAAKKAAAGAKKTAKAKSSKKVAVKKARAPKKAITA